MTVRHRNGEYQIRFRPLAQALADLPERHLVITDENVRSALSLQFERMLVVPPGEGSKTLGAYAELCSKALQMGVDRRTHIVAIGGGVIGDLAGFVAATLLRGVPLLQVPTSLLAQVDSSVGGKVGVDTPEGKNLIGAFWPPGAVEVCVDALKTLPERQFVNGTAEIWKAGFITDSDLLSHLPLQPASPHLESVIRRAIEIKARVVQEDEFETLGLRATLNFGHTIGHAIETCLGYETLLHGEAVSIGMVLESRLGEELGITPPGISAQVESWLRAQGLPVTLPDGQVPEALMGAMTKDKKALAGELAFSLLTGLGQCKLVRGVPQEAVRRVLGEP